MTEIEILEMAIGHVRKGDFLAASGVLKQSSNGQTLENAENCMRLSQAPNALLEDTLVYVLEQQLESGRIFGSGK